MLSKEDIRAARLKSMGIADDFRSGDSPPAEKKQARLDAPMIPSSSDSSSSTSLSGSTKCITTALTDVDFQQLRRLMVNNFGRYNEIKLGMSNCAFFNYHYRVDKILCSS